MDVKLEILAIGEIPDDLCGVCMIQMGKYIAIARAGGSYGALFVCEGCQELVRDRLMKPKKGLPN